MLCYRMLQATLKLIFTQYRTKLICDTYVPNPPSTMQVPGLP